MVSKPEFGLVTGDVLTYRCTGHDLIYDDLRMIYNDGSTTYERNRFDSEWHSMETKQPRQVDVVWVTPTRSDWLFSENSFFNHSCLFLAH